MFLGFTVKKTLNWFIYYAFTNKDVNISTKFELLTFSECNRVDCSITLLTGKTNLMVPWPEEESRILSPIRPFQLEVGIFFFPNKIIHTLQILCATRLGYYCQFRWFALDWQFSIYPNATKNLTKMILRMQMLVLSPFMF